MFRPGLIALLLRQTFLNPLPGVLLCSRLAGGKCVSARAQGLWTLGASSPHLGGLLPHTCWTALCWALELDLRSPPLGAFALQTQASARGDCSVAWTLDARGQSGWCLSLSCLPRPRPLRAQRAALRKLLLRVLFQRRLSPLPLLRLDQEQESHRVPRLRGFWCNEILCLPARVHYCSFPGDLTVWYQLPISFLSRMTLLDLLPRMCFIIVTIDIIVNSVSRCPGYRGCPCGCMWDPEG